MFKKNLYVLGSLIGLFIFIAIIAPPTEQTTGQNKSQDIESPTQQNIIVDSEMATVVVKPTESISTPTAQVVSNTEFQYYPVITVVDGDTIKVNINGAIKTLRLIGMDTPETVDPRKLVQCFGAEASKKAKELLTGSKIRIEKDLSQGELDKYGRTLAYVYRDDGLFYNKYMIEEGYAHEYTYNIPYRYQLEFKTAQKSAQENQRGLWSPNTCNGNTTSAAKSETSSNSTSSTVVKTGPEDTATKNTSATAQISGEYYTSSFGTAKYYYPKECSAWKGLSTKYLVAFKTAEKLKDKYSRTLSPQCQ